AMQAQVAQDAALDSNAGSYADTGFDDERREPRFLSESDPSQLETHQASHTEESISLSATAETEFTSDQTIESVTDTRELPIDYLIDCTVPIALSMQLRGEK